MKKNEYFKNLCSKVLSKSESANWEDAVKEWKISDWEEDATLSQSCICGKEHLRYLFTIVNEINGNALYPIGSTCIHKFNRSELDDEASNITAMYKLYDAINNHEFITLSSKYFSKKLLYYLYKKGAFEENEYNEFSSYNDYAFLLKMFMKRNKTNITKNQQGKINAIIYKSIIKFLKNNLNFHNNNIVRGEE